MNGDNGASARELLEKPFPAEAIRTRPGKHGETLSYVPTHHYVARLNAAYNGEWDFRITSSEVREDEIVVVARLTAGGVTKEDFGSAALTHKRETNDVIDIGDSHKSAASDALKRCCRLFGLGLTLYSEGDASDPAKPADNGKATQGNGAPPNRNGSAAPANNGNGDATRLSSRQLGMILGLAREKSISRDKLQAMVHERYGRGLEFITRAEASFFIGELQQAA